MNVRHSNLLTNYVSVAIVTLSCIRYSNGSVILQSVSVSLDRYKTQSACHTLQAKTYTELY